MKQMACQEWVNRDAEVVATCQHLSYFPLVVESAQGDIVTDKDGNRFIDFLTSASSLNLGSCHPEIMSAVQEQFQKCTQYTPAYTYNEATITYAENLVSVYPGGVKAKIAFGNCGSDANDCAVKFARAYTGRKKIITFLNSYHGNTYGSCSMTACTPRMREKMGPFLPEIYHFPYFGINLLDEQVERDCLQAIENAFSMYLSPEEVAAVVIEPIQGDGGILPAHPIFIRKLYDLCQKYHILFISEEVQQGFYRTGKFFAIEHYGVIPDGIIMGKSIGGGFPLGAFMARADIMDSLPAPAHLFTLGGNQVSCAAGNALFTILQRRAFQEQLARTIKLLWEEAGQLQRKHPDVVGFVRGIGMSMGIGIVKKTDTGEYRADPEGTYKILYRAYENHLLIINVGANVLRVQPPLNISDDHLRKGFAILDQAMTDFEKGDIPDAVLAGKKGW